MENPPPHKTKTFEDWLKLLSQASDKLLNGEADVQKVMTLSRVTDSAMKVIDTAINVAQMQRQPAVLSNLIGARPLVIESDDATQELEGRVRSELSIVAQELSKLNLTPARKAFLNAKRSDLESKLPPTDLAD